MLARYPHEHGTLVTDTWLTPLTDHLRISDSTSDSLGALGSQEDGVPAQMDTNTYKFLSATKQSSCSRLFRRPRMRTARRLLRPRLGRHRAPTGSARCYSASRSHRQAAPDPSNTGKHRTNCYMGNRKACTPHSSARPKAGRARAPAVRLKRPTWLRKEKTPTLGASSAPARAIQGASELRPALLLS